MVGKHPDASARMTSTCPNHLSCAIASYRRKSVAEFQLLKARLDVGVRMAGVWEVPVTSRPRFAHESSRYFLEYRTLGE